MVMLTAIHAYTRDMKEERTTRNETFDTAVDNHYQDQTVTTINLGKEENALADRLNSFMTIDIQCEVLPHLKMVVISRLRV